MFNTALENLKNEFKKLPGIGERSAERFSLFMIKQGGVSQKKFAKTLDVLEENLYYCPKCLGFSDGGECNICINYKRDSSIICVVENVFDISALEKTSSYDGMYHVLHGVLSPIDSVKPEDLKINELIKRVNNEEIKEIIFALSSTLEGEATMNYIKDRLPENILITHLARGIPNGVSLEYADEITLGRAIRERR